MQNKKLITFILSTVLFAAGALAQKKDNFAREKAAIDYINNSFSVYDKLQKSIWGYHELGFLEEKSSALLQKHLADNDFTVEKGVAGEPTGFIATFGSGTPVIGILAEFDALSGLSQDTVPYRKAIVEGDNGHGCGHQLLGTGAVAGAVAISKWLKATGTKGTVKLFGTPAEEGGGGKVFFAQDGLFNDTDAVLDWHPDGQNAVSAHATLARLSTIYHFTGKASHAAGGPDKGRSALDGVEALNYMSNLIREHMPMSSRIHYVITNGGGLSPNVVPAEAEVSYYVRAKNIEELLELADRVDNAARGAALGTGTEITIKRLAGAIYPVLPNKPFALLIQKNLERVGGMEWNAEEWAFAKRVAQESGIKAEDLESVKTVVPYTEKDFGGLSYGSSDVGDVSWNVPVGSFNAAAFIPGAPGHSWQNVAVGGTTIGTKGALTAAKVFALTVIDLFTAPKWLNDIKADFDASRGKDFKYQPIVPGKPELDYRVKK